MWMGGNGTGQTGMLDLLEIIGWLKNLCQDLCLKRPSLGNFSALHWENVSIGHIAGRRRI